MSGCVIGRWSVLAMIIVVVVITPPCRAADKKARVTRAKQLLQEGKAYPKGCSEFVAKVLDVNWVDANQLMGMEPKSVGKNNKYEGLEPGDIVGWQRKPGHGHVAIYTGEVGKRFIDVRDENEKPRLLDGYGVQELFKSSKY